MSQNEYSLLEKLKSRQFKVRPPVSDDVILYALHVRCMSFQAHKLLLNTFPLPVISLLNEIQEGAVGTIKASNVLKEENNISEDCIMMIDEMYLPKLHSIRAANMFWLIKRVPC